MSTIKSTITKGILLLLPLSIFGFVLFKVFQLMYQVAKLVDKIIPIQTYGGIVIVNILALFLLLLLCFLLGVLATNKRVDSFKNWIEAKVLMNIPGYLFLKGYSESIDYQEKSKQEFIPALISFDDNAQLGFLIEENKNGMASVFMPGAPSPWSGSVIYVENNRVKKLNIPVNEAIKHLQSVGRNSSFINE